MKTFNFLLFLVFITNVAFGQKVDSGASNDEKPHTLVERKAQPKEGLATFMKMFSENFDTTKGDVIPDSINHVKIRLKFIVEKDGSFSNFQMLDDVYNLGPEAIRVFGMMPKWEPARFEGKDVRSSFVLPITIKLKTGTGSSLLNVFNTERAIETHNDLLSSNKVETAYFNLTCNCTIHKAIISSDLETEEFYLMSIDNLVSYNVVLRNLSNEKARAELNKVKVEAISRNAVLKNLNFYGVPALNISFQLNEEGIESQYQSLFFVKNNQLIAVSLRSNIKQIVDLNFEHLLRNFKLKI